jgi:8-oxo-dGTP diphosphatase
MELVNDVATVIVVNEDDEVLLLKRSDKVSGGRGMWNFPGGSVEEGEEESAGASRELEEEAGLSTDSSELRYLGMKSLGKRFLHFFITDKYSGEVKINWESSEFAWTKVDNFDNYLFVGGGNVHPQVVEAIKYFIGERNEG